VDARKWDSNFLYETPPNPFHPPGSFPGTEMFVLDGNAIPGAIRVMVAWFAGPWKQDDIFKPHAHNHSEVLMFLGSDPDDPRKLGGEVEFWMEDDRYLITKSCIIHVPAMVQHAPMIPRRVDDPRKPILFTGIVPTTKSDDVMYYSRDPKWSEYKDPIMDWEGANVKWLDEVDWSQFPKSE
jgi:hypothetical protein